MGFPSNSVTTTKYSHKSIWRILRWPTALAGLVLIVVGQVQLASQTLPAGNPISLGKWLNDNWHLAIPSIDNVLRGAPLMLAGILLLAIAMRGLRLLPPDECPLDIRPFAIRLIRSAWPWVLVASVLFIILIVQLYQMSTQALLPMLWVATLAIFTAVIVAWDRRRQVSAAPRLSRQDLLWLIGLLLVGLLIATYRLQGWPDQLMGDEGNFWTIARDMARGLLKPSPFGVGVYSFPIFSSFLQAWGMNLFGIDVWGWRFGSVLAGVATVIPLYLLAREAFDRKVAIVASIVLITSPYFLDFSRLGYNNIQALFITVLALYWLYTGLQRSSNLLVFLAGIACGLGFYTFFSARGTVVVALAFVVLMWWTRKFHFKQAAHAVLLIGLGVLLVATPYFVYGYRQDPLGMGFKTFESVFFNTFNGEQFYTDAQLFKYAPAFTLGGNQLFFNPQIYGVLLMRGLIRTLLIFQKPWLISEHYIAFPLTGSVGSIFYVIGFFLVLKAVKQPRSQLILLWFLMEVLGFSTLNTVPPRYTHMVAIIPALALLTALGILGLVRAAAAIYTRVSRASNLILAVLLGAVAIGGLVDYFVTSPAQYPPQPDQIMSWAALESHGEQFIYVYTDPSQAGFRPYIVSEFRQDISFTSIPFDQFTQTSLSPESPNGTVVFYPPQISSQISPILYAQWGKTLIQRHFFAADDTPVLTASMNVPFVFERDHPLPDTFLDSLRRPAFLVLLALLVLALVTVAFFPTAWFPRFPTWLRPLADWFNRPETAEELFVREQEFEPLEIEAAPAGQAPTPAEPPEWAEVLPDAAPSGKSGRLAGVFRAVPTDSGRDIYLRIHIPRIRLPSSLGKKDLDISLPPVVIPGSLLLLAAVVLAAAAQVAIFIQHALIGGALYLACVAFLFVWAWKNPRWKGFFANQLRLSPLVEGLLLAGIVVAAAILRFHDLATVSMAWKATRPSGPSRAGTRPSCASTWAILPPCTTSSCRSISGSARSSCASSG